jgi:hypothetical protein
MDDTSHLLICVANEGADDLQVLKVYRRLPDAVAESKGFVRIVDDSGEDYLYPEALFRPLRLPAALEEQLEELATRQPRD